LFPSTASPYGTLSRPLSSHIDGMADPRYLGQIWQSRERSEDPCIAIIMELLHLTAQAIHEIITQEGKDRRVARSGARVEDTAPLALLRSCSERPVGRTSLCCGA
jgi:hypothetical protein